MPAFLSTDNYEPFSRISNYQGLKRSLAGKFVLTAKNVKSLVIRSESDIEPLKTLEEKLNMVEAAFLILSHRSGNIELDLVSDEIRENLQNITVITESFDDRNELDERMKEFLRDGILQEARKNGRSRQPVYLILIDLIQKECLIYD